MSALGFPCENPQEPIRFPVTVPFNPDYPFAALQAWLAERKILECVQYRQKNHIMTMSKEWFEFQCHRFGHRERSGTGKRRLRLAKVCGCLHRMYATRQIGALSHAWTLTSDTPAHAYHTPGTISDIIYLTLDIAVHERISAMLLQGASVGGVYQTLRREVLSINRDQVPAAVSAEELKALLSQHRALLPTLRIIYNMNHDLKKGKCAADATDTHPGRSGSQASICGNLLVTKPTENGYRLPVSPLQRLLSRLYPAKDCDAESAYATGVPPLLNFVSPFYPSEQNADQPNTSFIKDSAELFTNMKGYDSFYDMNHYTETPAFDISQTIPEYLPSSR